MNVAKVLPSVIVIHNVLTQLEATIVLATVDMKEMDSLVLVNYMYNSCMLCICSCGCMLTAEVM